MQPKTVAREPILDLVMFKRRVLSSIFLHNFYSGELKKKVEEMNKVKRELQQSLETLEVDNKMEQELKDKWDHFLMDLGFNNLSLNSGKDGQEIFHDD